MTDGWFAGLDADNVDAGARAIRDESADEPADWPAQAVEAGSPRTRTSTTTASRRPLLQPREVQPVTANAPTTAEPVHAVRAMDDCRRTANELAERVAEWAASRYDDAGSGVEYAREPSPTGRPRTPPTSD